MDGKNNKLKAGKNRGKWTRVSSPKVTDSRSPLCEQGQVVEELAGVQQCHDEAEHTMRVAMIKLLSYNSVGFAHNAMDRRGIALQTPMDAVGAPRERNGRRGNSVQSP